MTSKYKVKKIDGGKSLVATDKIDKGESILEFEKKF
jgi:hypothetical protein